MRIPFITQFIERRNATTTLRDPERWLIEALGGPASKAGARVNSATAIKVAAVFACVRLISETIASLPLTLYERKANGKGKDKAISHPLYALLKECPNPETTAFAFWQMFITNALLCGDAFALIVRNKDGRILELWNIPTGKVRIYRNPNTKERVYLVSLDDGMQLRVYPENMFHLQGMRFSKDDKSLDPIDLAREALGLALATEEFGSRFFSQGANLGGIVEYPGGMNDEAFERFKTSFNEKYSGLGNSSKVIFLEDGAKYQKISANPNESQFLETRKFQVVEIARFFNVPPHMIMDLERATFSNIEQQSINFVVYCLMPWFVRIEQTIAKDLLLPSERARFFTKYNANALLRGDTAARTAYYQAGRQNGYLSADDIRELEDMDALPEGQGGDVYLVNGNMIPATMAGKAQLKGGKNDDAANSTGSA